MTWEQLARAIIQDILQKQGGLCAIIPFLSLLIVIFVVGMSSRTINKKQKELDRKSEEKEKLERELLKKRLSTSKK